MQIPALSSNVQSVLGNNSRDSATTQPVANEEIRAAERAAATQVSGSTANSDAAQPVESSVQETASADASQSVASTQVVTNADELSGTNLGLNIDTTA